MKITILKPKIQKIVSEHPKVVTLGIGIATTLALGMALGVEPQQAHAIMRCPTC
jgi:hypothetical protein